ncbi:hypothetical protein EXS70_03290 [Candidatus Peribacteria bacterium]|nr:hypothetical protein [Candidatus Peribacteria bacterium]
MAIQDFLSTLQIFGFTPEESAVYLVSLELGAQPASVIAKKAKLKRGQTYNVLSQLKDKGIVQEFTKDGVRQFTGQSPSTLLSLLAAREEDLAVQKQKILQLMPFLEKLRNPLIVQPKVRFYQGVSGLKEVYNDTIKVPDQVVYAVCDFEHTFPAEHSKELHNWLWQYTDRRAAQNVTFHGIVNKSKESDLAYKWRRKQKRKMKMLKNVYLPVELMIYGDKVALLSTKDDMVGVIIEDKPIAEMLRNMLQAIWPFLPDYR